jgi:hypothetical protein
MDGQHGDQDRTWPLPSRFAERYQQRIDLCRVEADGQVLRPIVGSLIVFRPGPGNRIDIIEGHDVIAGMLCDREDARIGAQTRIA